MKKLAALLIIVLTSAPAVAGGYWMADIQIDEFSGTTSYLLYADAPEYDELGKLVRRYFGIRCDVDLDAQRFMFTFDAGEFVDSYGQAITMEFKVDDNQVVKMNGYTFSNSKKAGRVLIASKHERVMAVTLLRQMSSGEALSVSVSNSSKSRVFTMNLQLQGVEDDLEKALGFAEKSGPVINACSAALGN